MEMGVKPSTRLRVEDRSIVDPPYVASALVAVAIAYAFLAGFRTVHDYDLGWQMATARWIVLHHQIPNTDALSYTAKGKPWIYPALSGLVFYGLYCLGGYAALTWLTAVASGLTAFFLTRQRAMATGILAIMAVPVIMTRLTPRADLFSTVLFAVFLSIIWRYYRTEGENLCLLPVIMLLWVNLHWGFVAGLGLCAAYVVLELCEFLFQERRGAAQRRFRSAWPWLAGAVLSTLVNPWGISLYSGVITWINDLRAGASAKTAATVTVEYLPLRFNLTTLQGALSWRNPELSAIWWLLGIACIATLASFLRKNYGASVLLAASAAAAVEVPRFQGMFACVLVIVGGSVLIDAIEPVLKGHSKRWHKIAPVLTSVVAIVSISFIALATVRGFDLVSNRYYVNSLPYNFGTGLSWWYPERALEFVEHEHLPGNVYNSFVLGGYLVWRLPQYPDFIDGRGRPFQGEVFETGEWLPLRGPESQEWRDAATKYGINLIVVPATRIEGLGYFQRLQEFCNAQTWTPVYLDEISAVFVRRSPETRSLIERLKVDCNTIRFSPPSVDKSSWRGRADLFNFWTNSAILYLDFGRPQDAIKATDEAQQLFEASSHLHLERAVAFQMLNRTAEAEKEFARSIELKPDDQSLLQFAKLLWNEGRTNEAMIALRKAADLSQQPSFFDFQLGEAEVQLRHPREALAAFDEATRSELKWGVTTPDLAEFHARVAEGRANAWVQLGDATRVIQYELQALQFTPGNPDRWKKLADLYESMGNSLEAQVAMQKAQQTSASAQVLAPQSEPGSKVTGVNPPLHQ